ncbi:S1/P1 nuclease [Lutibacter sp. A80]|uniref:S1/P1 nuclease n=1 Tax=Lutibacter sp. A80 TaxID=2918453 RepID=UPI001F05D175|nr:S1/P1 nuclease [Lutibacter sp. A80]UMB60447.1 S1/P1 nuclease [Lutibacter sp. A80]
MKFKSFSCILIVFLFSFSSINAINPNWGGTGHRTIGKIAEGYLKAKTKRKIAELLNGKSLAFVSTFGDEIKSDSSYDKFNSWHYINIPFGAKYMGAFKNPEGDLMVGITKCKEVLLDDTSSKEDKVFYLKMLVHLIGDLHQPLHVANVKDRGGNDLQVKWFNKETNLHRVWDSDMIDSYNMSYTELVANADKISKKQVKYLQKGTVLDWVDETHQLAGEVYKSAKMGDKLGYRYMYDYFSLARNQLQVAGIRLAKVLNDLFS